MTRFALDSNVLVYAHSLSINDKTLKTVDLMAENPVVSSQAISEYLNVMRHKLKTEKNELMQKCTVWLEDCTVQPVVLSTIKLAKDLIAKYDFQLFDGIIVAAALESNCDILYSEDLHDGLLVENTLRIVNPFI